MLITRHATQSYTTLNRRRRKGDNFRRFDKLIIQTLVIALAEIMRAVFAKGKPERTFAEWDQALKTLFFNGANKPFRNCIAPWRPWRTSHRFAVHPVTDRSPTWSFPGLGGGDGGNARGQWRNTRVCPFEL